jgi:hypothetical protein
MPTDLRVTPPVCGCDPRRNLAAAISSISAVSSGPTSSTRADTSSRIKRWIFPWLRTFPWFPMRAVYRELRHIADANRIFCDVRLDFHGVLAR